MRAPYIKVRECMWRRLGVEPGKTVQLTKFMGGGITTIKEINSEQIASDGTGRLFLPSEVEKVIK